MMMCLLALSLSLSPPTLQPLPTSPHSPLLCFFLVFNPFIFTEISSSESSLIRNSQFLPFGTQSFLPYSCSTSLQYAFRWQHLRVFSYYNKVESGLHAANQNF